MRELGADDRRVPGVRNGLEVVDEATLAAEQRLVLDAEHRLPDPGLAPRSDRQAAKTPVVERRALARRR